MQTVKKKISELHKTEKNIRRHSEKQIQEYIRSLKMFGQIRPLVVTEDGEILVGNGMFEALTVMQVEDCDVYVVEGLSNAQKKKLMLADNKVYELGFTDIGVLDDILDDLKGDFDVPGYSSDLLETISANALEADDLVSDYGTASVELSEKHSENEKPVTFAQSSTSQYEPPVRTDDGAFVAPTQKSESESESEKKYIICSHCGEKIWL